MVDQVDGVRVHASTSPSAVGPPAAEDLDVTPVTPHGWRVTDRRLPDRHPLRLLAFVEQRDERFEVMQAGAGLEWHEFDSLPEAVAFVVATAPSRTRARRPGADRPSAVEAAAGPLAGAAEQDLAVIAQQLAEGALLIPGVTEVVRMPTGFSRWSGEPAVQLHLENGAVHALVCIGVVGRRAAPRISDAVGGYLRAELEAHGHVVGGIRVQTVCRT